MADQIPDFIDGDLNLSNRVKAAWLNDVNDATYRANTGISGATPNRTALSKFADTISVKDFGALGDGVTDDAPAIRAAVVSLGAGNGDILFPKPVSGYLLKSAIDLSGKANITFQGCGGLDIDGPTTKIIAHSSLTGPVFTCDTANAARSGAFKFSGLHFYAAQLNVDAFKIRSSGTPLNARMIEFEDCGFEGLRTGAWLGDYTADTPNLTTILGANFYRCIFRDVVRPIVADAGGFDGIHTEQVWVVDPNNRMTHGISVLLTGSNLLCENTWIGCGDSVAYGIYFANPDVFTIRDSAIEANDGGETFIGIYQPTGAAPPGAVIIDNTRINHTAVAAVAVDVSNPSGMEIRSSYFMGNVNVGSGCITHTQNVRFSGAFGYTGTTANVFEDGVAKGAWTPALSFSTPGNLAVAYTTQLGRYKKRGKLVTADFNIITSSFTHTTAAGGLLITGLPFTAEATYQPSGAVAIYSGVTAANNQHIGVVNSPSTTTLLFYGSGSAVAQIQISTGQVPTGGTVVLYGTITYLATA